VTAALAKALELNPRQPATACTYQADNLIDREDYSQAEEVLEKVPGDQREAPAGVGVSRGEGPCGGDRERKTPIEPEALSTWHTKSTRGGSPHRSKALAEVPASPKARAYQRAGA
jgi:hypothetical protein